MANAFRNVQGNGWHRARSLDPSPYAGVILILLLMAAGLMGLGDPERLWTREAAKPVPTVAFGLCSAPPHRNCVVDGDTFYFHDRSIRIADMDAPETHPARCGEEARLGARATARLQELLNAGGFEIRPYERDTDTYGRQLRIVTQNGRSVGAVLVAEGLARPWTGRRMPWCG